ncbi:LemA family protein [Campylobacter suis]|uniref:Protein LemA n=1 Tax=Campylobacter suis TaxID=2790657 RepID=A0ABN7K3S1_9BACT|nr:LemA family protein [Campylobacter suis]CAD7287176.1 Protein LemA [Campylobacter suis]
MKILGFIVGALLLLGVLIVPQYNKFPVLDEGVSEKWSQVQNQYKRRADLIPNLVSTVQGYASHEKSVFTEVTEARSRVSNITLDASSLSDPAKVKAFLEAQNSLGGALSRLMAVSENYPQLKADQNFITLQNQLEGTENRISVARKDYITAVKEYNVALRTFPGNLVAKFLHPSLSPKANFEASEAEQSVPTVSFEKK